MYVDLKYRTKRAMPGGCSLVGWIELDNGMGLPLAWNAHKGAYCGVLRPATPYPIADQGAIAAAVAEAYAQGALEGPAAPEQKYMVCRIDRWAADIFRQLGAGNLCEGFRRAARMIEARGK